MRLAGKTAVITGAARGIGRGIAEAFAGEGAAVAICDIDGHGARKTAVEIRDGLGVETCAVEVDVRDRGSVLTMTDTITRHFGRIDVVVNNAGISKVVAFLEMDEALWDATVDTNLKGTFLCCQAVLPQMVQRRNGKIVNVSSQSGKRGSAQYAAYCASKFGVIGLTQSLAQEYAPFGIHINAVCPGVVFTELWRSQDMLDKYAAKRGIPPETVEDYFKTQIPLGRLCTPEDVAKVVVFLASEDSDYMTGQALNVTGGAEMR
jgi:NAD(P)-dependent dehydrogenase (short-subunit alcohol dehydrogenase family)